MISQTEPNTVNHQSSRKYTHLPNIHAVAKSFQGHFQQDFFGQLVARIKNDVALNLGLHTLMCRTQLVVARLGGVVTVCDNISVLQDTRYSLTEPEVKVDVNQFVYLAKELILLN